MKYAKYELVLKKCKVHESKTEYTATRSESVYRFATKVMRLHEKPEENMCVIVCSNKLEVTGYYTVSVGSINQALVHPREVFKPAIVMNAAAIILLHNHPSGDPTPSDEDIATTKRLVECGDLLGIEVLDHVIIGDGYASMRSKGLLRKGA